jgi:DNA polymerase-3 subunit epsilon
MLDDALRRTFGIRLRNPLVDTARLAMSTIDAFHQTGYSNQRPPTLDEVCAKAGVALIDRHTAVGDAFTTAQLFLFLCAKLKHMLGRELIVDDIPYQSS